MLEDEAMEAAHAYGLSQKMFHKVMQHQLHLFVVRKMGQEMALTQDVHGTKLLFCAIKQLLASQHIHALSHEQDDADDTDSLHDSKEEEDAACRAGDGLGAAGAKNEPSPGETTSSPGTSAQGKRSNRLQAVVKSLQGKNNVVEGLKNAMVTRVCTPCCAGDIPALSSLSPCISFLLTCAHAHLCIFVYECVESDWGFQSSLLARKRDRHDSGAGEIGRATRHDVSACMYACCLCNLLARERGRGEGEVTCSLVEEFHFRAQQM